MPKNEDLQVTQPVDQSTQPVDLRLWQIYQHDRLGFYVGQWYVADRPDAGNVIGPRWVRKEEAEECCYIFNLIGHDKLAVAHLIHLLRRMR